MISRLDYELLVLYREERPLPESANDKARFRALLAQKLVEPTRYRPDAGGLSATHYQVTPAGKNALLEFEENAKRQAKQERQQRFDNKISVLSVLVPLLTFLLGVWVEYRLSLIEVLVQIVP